MRDTRAYNILGLVLVVALFIFLLTPHPPGSTSEKVRDTVRDQISVTADRINNAFDAAKTDAQRQGR